MPAGSSAGIEGETENEVLFLESDRGKKGNKTFYIAVGIIILVLLSLYTLFMMWIGGGYLEEGLAGYISHTVKMTGLAVALGALLVYSYRRIESRREYSINTADVMYLPHTRIVMELEMGRLSLQ